MKYMGQLTKGGMMDIKGIGGTDAAIISETSKWGTPLQLYYEKRGEIPIEKKESGPMLQWGHGISAVEIATL